VICLAPELDRSYDRLYAYLQDDITRKKPSIDLILDLLCFDQFERWKSRPFFSENAPLLRYKLLQFMDDPHSPTGSSDLARFLKLDPRILDFILGDNRLDCSLAGFASLHFRSIKMNEVPVAPVVKRELLNLAKHYLSLDRAKRQRLVLHFYGPYGVGKRDLALGLCKKLKLPMLWIDMEAVISHKSGPHEILKHAVREGLLQEAVLYLYNSDGLLNEDDRAKSGLIALTECLTDFPLPTILAGHIPWSKNGVFANTLFYSVELAMPPIGLQKAFWKKMLTRQIQGAQKSWAEHLAVRYRLTPGQIKDAINFARTKHVTSGDGQRIQLVDLCTACRNQTNHKLRELATKIEPRCGWKDIVLPQDKVDLLREICNQVEHRHRVYDQWGFGKNMARGKGLSVLFTGSPGTGKTLAAEVMANELGLDLYKIDLSGVVSKYVGETEKNLDGIFKEAEASNGILFFDEADALFGKRTQISDAHDRYANIEVSYLLQKMEEYEGIVILATNLRDNMDAAFTRRIKFVVEFPFPDEESRLQIWKDHVPKEAPVNRSINYQYLAERFPLSGGNIANTVLNSAFLASDIGSEINMDTIIQGTKREYEKVGKLWDEHDFENPKE
jgi:ATP-dependent 26S proteasome regulatory subunit